MKEREIDDNSIKNKIPNPENKDTFMPEQSSLFEPMNDNNSFFIKLISFIIHIFNGTINFF